MAFPSMDEQERILKEASTNVKKSAYFMRKALVSPRARCGLGGTLDPAHAGE